MQEIISVVLPYKIWTKTMGEKNRLLEIVDKVKSLDIIQKSLLYISSA